MIASQQPEPRFVNGVTHTSPRISGTRFWNSPFLSHDEREALDQAMLPPRSVEPNVDLIREGEPATGVFILTDGWACRYTTTRDGGRQLSALLLPGDVANPDAVMFERSDDGVRTLTKATVVVLPRESAISLAEEHPGIARTFTWLAMVENAIMGRRALSLGRKHAIERLAHLLSELSVRLAGAEGGTRCFTLPLTQEQIADALGLTPVHVNRMMQQLRTEGLIVTEQRLMTLLDVPALRRIGGFDPRYLHVSTASRPSSA